MKTLTPKRQLFVEYYVATMFNGTKAATLAGYSERSAYSEASRLLRIAEVKAAIDAHMDAMLMPAREVLMRMSDQGRATMEDFITIDADGKTKIDIAKAAANGKLHHIKDIKRTTRTRKNGAVEFTEEEFSIELHDASAARVHLGKYHKLFTERVEINVVQDKIIALLKDGSITPEQAREELGQSLAEELFNAAGISVTSSRED
jgi:phage terminase small subunit